MVVDNVHRAVLVKSQAVKGKCHRDYTNPAIFNRKKGEKELGVSQEATGFALR